MKWASRKGCPPAPPAQLGPPPTLWSGRPAFGSTVNKKTTWSTWGEDLWSCFGEESSSPGTVLSIAESWWWGRRPTLSHPGLSSRRSRRPPDAQRHVQHTKRWRHNVNDVPPLYREGVAPVCWLWPVAGSFQVNSGGRQHSRAVPPDRWACEDRTSSAGTENNIKNEFKIHL